MQIEFDPDKDSAHRAKHGIALEVAANLRLDEAVVIEDRRAAYGEERFIAHVPLRGRLHVLWYTWRGGVVRVIGLRKANDRERNRYDKPT